MTDEQKQQITTMRRDGAGYGKIAVILGISINTVKSFCRRHNLVTKKTTSVCEQCGSPLNRIRDASGNDSAAMPVVTMVERSSRAGEAEGGLYIHLPKLRQKVSVSMATAIGSSVPMPAMSSIASEMVAMDKRLFRNEATFQVTMYLARVMLAEKLITEKEYQTSSRRCSINISLFWRFIYLLIG